MRVQMITRWRRASSVLLVSLGVLRVSAQSIPSTGTLLTIDASARPAAPETGYLQMGSSVANKEVGLKRFGLEVLAQGMEVKVLPLRRDAPIYMPNASWPEFKAIAETAEVKAVTVSPEYEVKLTVRRETPTH